MPEDAPVSPPADASEVPAEPAVAPPEAPEAPPEPSHKEKIEAAASKLAQALSHRADLHAALVHVETEVQSLEKLHRLLVQSAPTEHPPFVLDPQGKAVPNPALVKK